MSLNIDFDGVAGTKPRTLRSDPAIKPKRKRDAPFAIRLSKQDRARLTEEARGAPRGGYIKTKVLGTAPLRSRASGHSVEDRKALAQALALLGQNRLASNLNQLAHATNIGALPMTPETEDELRAALAAVREIRNLLVAALGMKAEAKR